MALELEPEGGERRVYTDERVPGIEIHNDGGPLFVIIDTQTGQPVDEFTAHEVIGRTRQGGTQHTGQVSEQFAQRRAQAYFDRMAEGEMGAELGAREEPEPESEPVPIKTNRLQWQPKPQPPPHPRGKLGDPLRGMTQMTAADVDEIIARAKSEPDPARARALRQQALSMMQQMESLPQRIVRVLLDA